MKLKGFLLLEVVVGVMIAAVMLVAVFRLFAAEWTSNRKSVEKILLINHMENLSEDFFALENNPGFSGDLFYENVDVKKLWNDVKSSAVNKEILCELNYDGRRYEIFFKKQSYEKGVYSISAFGKGGGFSTEYNFSVKKF